MGARDDLSGAAPPTLSGDTLREYVFSAADFDRVRRMIYARAGINLNDSKQNMVYSRLSRRLRATGIDSFAGYLDALDTDAAFADAELQEFINALTTNLTSFFREAHHFPVLAEYLRAHAGVPNLRLWCAAASTGEEPYTLTMTMHEALGPNTSARLLATDIDTNVLAVGRRGVYKLDAARSCGDARLRQFFLRGKGGNDGLVRVRPELGKLIEFATLNLLEDAWPALRAFAPQVDAVFCRNVMIYFDKPTQRRILARIAGFLKPGGLLFVGHSENFTDCREHFHLRGKTVYERV
ncbi:MAG TPA: CheR family methyltransferase [Burkholderiaceae bacterium]|nr:CheR family methyltransferase [Burkholderiaceae bacterium]